MSLQKDYKLRLKEFAKDKSYFGEYDAYTPLGDEVLVKIFKYVATEDLAGQLGKTSILVPSPLTGEYKPSTIATSEKIFPIVKIIKKGSGDFSDPVEIGGLYIVPTSEVGGDDWNPDFMWMMQNFAKQGKSSGIVTIPDDMPQKLPKLEKNWERYAFAMPDRLEDETKEDKLVYLIPAQKLKAIYNYGATSKPKE